MTDHDILFDDFILGNVKLKNRLVMPAIGTNLASLSGEVTPAMLAYYGRRAQGGIGAIIVEIACVDNPAGRGALNQLIIDKPAYIPKLNDLSETIKQYGCAAFIQLHHAGRQTNAMITENQGPVAPSPIACKFMQAQPKELDLEGIQSIKQKFVMAAIYARQAGFDGIELHGAHGYLLSQFLSPYTNKREDIYGGPTENRVRLLEEIIQGIKNAVPGLIIGVRFNVVDFVEGGIELKEGIKIAKLLEKAGADLLNASCGIYETGHTSIETASFDEGWRMYMAAAVKEAVKIPVLAGGALRGPDKAAEFLAAGKADLVWMARSILADPDWPVKVMAGVPERIRPCITCNTCIDRLNRGLSIRCSVNPVVGRESFNFKPLPSLIGKKALVVGAGPAGLQAALSLQHAGANVRLIEASSRLGGKLNVADKAPHKDKVGLIRDYLVREASRSGMEIKLDTPYSEAEAEAADLIVVAAGSVPKTLVCENNDSIPVYNLEKILSQDEILTEQKVLILGGGSNGCETALFLAEKGNDVVIIEQTGRLAAGVENMSRLELLISLKQKSVMIKTRHSLSRIDGNTVVLFDHRNNSETVIEQVQAIVTAIGYTSAIIQCENISNRQIQIIGDAASPRNIMEAIFEGQKVVDNFAAALLN